MLHYIMVKTQSVPDLELPAAASASLWTPNPLHPNLHLKSQSTNTKNLWPSFGRNWSVRDSPNVNVPVVNCYLKKSIDLDSSGKAETLSGSFWARHLLSRYSSTTALTQMSTNYDVKGIFCICLMKHRDLLCSDNTKETTITTITTATTTTTITTTTITITTTTTIIWTTMIKTSMWWWWGRQTWAEGCCSQRATPCFQSFKSSSVYWEKWAPGLLEKKRSQWKKIIWGRWQSSIWGEPSGEI